MIVYIAGPMAGLPNYNRPAFHAVATALTDEGFAVLNPATLPDGLSEGQYMQICCQMVHVSDRVMVLPGWEKSEGARIEVQLAQKAGKIVMTIAGEMVKK
ncbi:MAG: DUF4406 domain-containing protein [Aeromonas sp.]